VRTGRGTDAANNELCHRQVKRIVRTAAAAAAQGIIVMSHGRTAVTALYDPSPARSHKQVKIASTRGQVEVETCI